MSPKRSNDRPGKRRYSGPGGIGHDTDLNRRSPSRESWSAAVITNGKCTEFQYFTALKDLPWITARVRVRFQAGTPKDTVKRAALLLREEGYDEAWAVFDVDEFDVGDAMRAAMEAGVGIAMSNPCFEVWLILHHEPCARHFESAERVGVHLKRALASWDKTKLSFADFADGLDEAVKRAQRLAEPPEGNPSTGVWKLIEALRRDHSEEE
jgi:hypothetical protein